MSRQKVPEFKGNVEDRDNQLLSFRNENPAESFETSAIVRVGGVDHSLKTGRVCRPYSTYVF